MKLNLLFAFLLLGQLLSAQIFTGVSPKPPFVGVQNSAITFEDVNGDSYPDVLVTGRNSSFVPISKLYTNDGAGHYMEVAGAPFEGVQNSSIAFEDVNGDNYPDVLITGQNSSGVPISKLYTNDGAGNFMEMPGTPFEGISSGSVTFQDVNGNDHPDVLITGQNSLGVPVSKLYTNDGGGSFTEMTETPFEDLEDSSVAFEDINGDSHPDVLITGQNNSGVPTSKLYTNDGAGHFTEMADTPFDGVSAGSIAFEDVNDDDYPDVLITGWNGSAPISKLYTNDGAGHFTEIIGTPFEGVSSGFIAIDDVNSDDHPDVLITGWNGSTPISKLYTNDGAGHYTEVAGTPFEGVIYSSIAFKDVNSDNHPDALITGQNSSYDPILKLYTNDGAGHFTEIIGTPFEGVYSSSIAFEDVNSDDYPDVLITGWDGSAAISKLYSNDGAGHFTEMTETPFEGVEDSSVAFEDVNGDNYPDVLITGRNSSFVSISKLYTNDGTGHFMEMTEAPFEGVESSSMAFEDVNGDNHPDVLITGEDTLNARIWRLYINDGVGHFTEMTDTPFEGVFSASIAFEDVNDDNYPDVLITGQNSSGVPISKLYTNDGAGHFTEMTDTPFDGVSAGSIAFEDVNGDNHPDVLITGLNSSYVIISKLYINEGTGHFTEMTDTPFEGVYLSSIAFEDVNEDSRPDVLITGQASSGRISKLYTNDGAGHFTEMTETPFEGIKYSAIAFEDVNGDNHPDVLITGQTSSGRISKLYINNGGVSSTNGLDNSINFDFSLYPNPTKAENINIKYSSIENEWVEVKLYSLNGHLLRRHKEFSTNGEQKTFAIDIASLSQGSYFIELEDGKRRGIAKFIVQ